MDRTDFRLIDFFQDSDFSDKNIQNLENRAELRKLKEELSGAVENLPVSKSFMSQILNQFKELLNIDIRTILLNAWKQSINFEKYLNLENTPPGEAVILPLADHKISSEHTPYLQPYLNDIALGEIKFHINLNLQLSGVIIKIQDQKITEINLGSCRGDCQITYKDVVLLDKKGMQFALHNSLQSLSDLPIREILKPDATLPQPETPPGSAAASVHHSA